MFISISLFRFRKGSEIITPALTFSTTLAPILQLGYKPKFIDSQLNTYVPSVEQL
jgi:CDP-6-deoxy-D-xylo-4-hexulose-3-dehydrase